MYKVVNFFRATDQPNLSTLDTTLSGEDGISAPPSTPIEGLILPEEAEEGEREEGGEQEKDNEETEGGGDAGGEEGDEDEEEGGGDAGGEEGDEDEEEDEDEEGGEFISDTMSTYSMDGDFIRLGHRNTPLYEPFEAQFFCSSDLDNLIDRYRDIHELPEPHDVRFENMLSYLGWRLPSNEIVADSLKWALIMKIRASLENELMTKWGFHEIHHVSNSDNPGEYVVHAIYRGVMPENLPLYFFRIKYVCMYFGCWSANQYTYNTYNLQLATCECDHMLMSKYTSEPGQGLDSAAEHEASDEAGAHTKSEGEGKAGPASGNGAEPKAEPFSDPAREEGKNSRATSQAPAAGSVQQEPQPQEQKQAKKQQEKEQQQGQPQQPPDQQEPQGPPQCQQPQQSPELSELRWREYLSRAPALFQQQSMQLPPQKPQQHAQQQGQAQSPQAQAQAKVRVCVSQNHQSPQSPPQAQANSGTAPFLPPLPQPPTQWTTSVFHAWDTFQKQALEASEVAHRHERQVRQLSASHRAGLGEGIVSSSVSSSIHPGCWAPMVIPSLTLPPLESQREEKQTTSNRQYGRPLNQASGGVMCDPNVALGLLRGRPNIGDMDEYLEKYGTRYGSRRI